ncbi:MAG: thiamine-phosphate kinase [Verrucomicrobia bacterium]|nr:thiamine-phosphate kinase [Verrucomicrobiota bacterium]
MHPFADDPARSISALGEAKLIAAIRRWLGDVSPRAPFGVGDDCAVLRPARGRQLITVDPVIYGRHFDATVSPREAGAKLLKRNLSDIAAMGGRPVAAVLAVTLDPRVHVRWLELFYRGLAAAARRYRVAVVGGDLAESPGVVAAGLTLLGQATGRRILTRTGARAGDWIFVTGELGASRPSGHHLRFAPRLAEGSWLARRAEVRSMLDVSDGLAKDLPALTPRGCVAALDAAAVPRRRRASLRAALTDGEDYELLFSVATRTDRAALARAWQKNFPRTRLTCIGRFLAGTAPPSGRVRLDDYRGYEHFR